jgi:hypothetical protein
MSKTGGNADLSALTEIDRLIHEPARLAVMALLYVVDRPHLGQPIRSYEQTGGGRLSRSREDFQREAAKHDAAADAARTGSVQGLHCEDAPTIPDPAKMKLRFVPLVE